MIFEAHGELNIEWIGNCCVLQPMGAINEEGAKSFNKIIEKSVRNAGKAQWFRVECLEGPDTLATPEAYKQFYENTVWALNNGCIMTTLVSPHAANHFNFNLACEKAKMPFRCFKNLQDALQFCRSQSMQSNTPT